MAKKKCPWCQGGGFCANLWDLGYRRSIMSDADSRRLWADRRRYRCPECAEPKELPEAPEFVPAWKREKC